MQLVWLVALTLFACGGSADTTSTTDGASNDGSASVTEDGGSSTKPGPKDMKDDPTAMNQSGGPPPPPVKMERDQCKDKTDGGPLMEGSECITAELKCGETIEGHTIGGVDIYDTKFWEKNFCWPATVNHESGDERVYTIDVPDGDYTVDVTLDTPCADLNMMAFQWKDGGCAEGARRLRRCESNVKKGTKRERMLLVSQKATTWYIVVEGRDDEEGAFALTTECREALF